MQSEQVLIVDDNPLDRALFRRYLGDDQRNVEVIEACRGDEGLAKALGTNTTCILLDYNLPDMNGITFLDRLAANEDDVTPPVIMLTDYGSEAVAATALKHGADDYLPKSALTAGSLRQALDDVYDRQEEKIDSAKRQEAINSFAFTAAHDLQAPLRRIGLIISMLKDMSASDPVVAEYVAHLDMLDQDADRLRLLVSDLLAFCQSEVSASDFEPVSLNDAITDALSNLSVQIREKAARIDLELPDIWVLGRAPLMSSLFQNLISNGIKFCNTQPHIVLEASDVGGHWGVSVRDNGVGIPQEHQAKIFNPLYRGNHEFEGSGLGLATCRRIVESHGGTIHLQSKIGIGSKFYVTLQKCQSPMAA